MGVSTRHYKALMKKNWINWKRTPCGSILEIICPIFLMLILVYARSQTDPVYNKDFSLYTLRRPFYPIAKPELGNKFVVSIADQQRQLDDYRAFFDYMDAININMTVPINVTQAVEVMAQVTGQPNVAQLVGDVKNDIKALTNLTKLIEMTPIKDFTKNIDWEGLGKILKAFGLDKTIDIQAIKAFAEEIENQLEHPEALLQELIGVNITAIVDNLVNQLPDTNNIENINIDIVGYLPMLDFIGPYAFFPSHCYPGAGRLKYNSPIIAYVKTGSSIENDIIEQMTSLFKFQKTLVSGLKTMNLMGISSELLASNKAAVNFIRKEELEAVGKAVGDKFGVNSTKVQDDLAKKYMNTDSFMKAAKNVGNFTFKMFDSKADLDNYIGGEKMGTDKDNPGVCFGFSVHEENSNKFELELFFNDMQPNWFQAVPNHKKKVFNSFDYAPNLNGYSLYTQQGFSMMQNWVANTILKRKTGVATASIVAMAVPTKLPPYVEDDFNQLLTQALSAFILIMFVPPMYRTSFRIVAEKESKVKESMRMMGLEDASYWLSWYTYHTIVNSIICICSWTILFIYVMPKSSAWILFLVIWLFGQSLFGLLLITQSLFAKARSAAITASLVYFGTAVFQQLLIDPDVSFKMRMYACLSPTVAMLQTLGVLTKFEASQVGSNIDNIFSEYNNFTVGHGLLMMLLNCAWITVLGLYLDQVMPKTFGRRRHPCFFFMREFWGSCCCRKNKVPTAPTPTSIKDNAVGVFNEHSNNAKLPSSQDNVVPDLTQSSAMPNNQNIIEQIAAFETSLINPDCYEKLTSDVLTENYEKNILKVTGLEKQYSNGFKAVNGINVQMFTDQIFVLLGHNGAGKSTTISMLSGLISSTKGQANLFGLDMFSQMDEVRKTMGVCPQHDVLFELLTPQEHLDIFYEFKGADQANKKKEIDMLLRDIGLDDKRNAKAQTLSGGNKRKLSLSIALCGNSKFVLLDEPTSGLDIQARRQLWNMLRQYRKNRIILLTTHYMDEADILGDRIGIMTQGKMTCLGSSMFLKSRFGVGYVMTVVKSNAQPNQNLMAYLKDKLGPDVQKVTEIQGEMTIQFPKEYSALFRDFFTDFDNDLASLDVISYGISVTTLEQVFLDIGHNLNPKPRFVIENGTLKSETSDHNSLELRNNFDLTTPNQDSRSGLEGLISPKFQSAKVTPVMFNTEVESSIQKQNGENTNVADSKRRYKGDKKMPRVTKLDNLIVPAPHEKTKGTADDLFNVGVYEGDDINADDSAVALNGHLEKTSSKKNHQDMEEQNTPGKNDGPQEDEKFSLAESKLDNSFRNNFTAVMVKKFSSYKRNKKQMFVEIFLPCAFMVIGVYIASIDFTFRSPQRVISPSLYPLKQKLLINEKVRDAKNSNLSPQIFAQNLPDFERSFDVTYSSTKNVTKFDNFALEVFEYGVANSRKEPYIYGSYEIFQADRIKQEYKFVSYVNLTSADSVALFPQFMYESILKVATDDPLFEFKVRSTPYALTNELKKREATASSGALIFFSAIAYSMFITLTVSYLVVERISQLKHVQVITGMRLDAYWIANFIFDACKLYVTVIATIVLIYAFNQKYDSSVVVYALFPFAIIPFTYVTSFLFTAESAAQTFTMFFHAGIILVFSTLVFVMRATPTLELVGDIINYVLRIVPSYSLAASMYFDSSGSLLANLRKSSQTGDGDDINPDPWYWTNNTLDILMMPAHFFFWTFVLFIIETDLGKRLRKCWQCCIKLTFPKLDKDIKLDPDVVFEAERVASTPNDQFRIKVQNLRKVYSLSKNCCQPKTLVAVENISFGLESGECFALLGVNGAGKSTTFKSLTSEVEPTAGTIHIASLDIRKDFNKIKKLVGYCPQTNPIFEYMTVEENIEYFARIKGIPNDKRLELCNRAIIQLDLEPHRKKLSGDLSGGNKRKLSVALAIVGSPPIILLDEPSAGMDPEARRFMWRVVEKIASDKTSAVILTTHSMEEAEALSTKMGIMVKGGVFKCFGTSQHIKDKFGTGFVIEIKAQLPMAEEIKEVREGLLSLEHLQDDHVLKEFLTKTHVTAEEASKILAEAQVPGIVIESILHLDTKQDSEVEAEEAAKVILKRLFTFNDIAQDIFIKGALFGVIESLCHEFMHVEVIEHYGNYMRLRVERQNKTIGSVFKLIEELKEEHQLEDYSISQTTLEQIFQGFADLKFNENVPTYCIDEDSGELARIVFE